MPNTEPMSVIDAAWLRMDRPTNLMMICGMMTFADRVDLTLLREVIRTRMLCFHRFTQRVVHASPPFWETDPDFDLEWHVRHIALPHATGLEEVVGDLVSTPLDPSKPMWQFHLIDTGDEGSAIVVRIHHCYGDGFALMHVLASMTDDDPEHPHLPAEDVGAQEDNRGAWERILGPASEAVGDAVRATSTMASASLELLAKPMLALEYGKTGLGLAMDWTTIVTMAPDSHTRFKGPLGVMKRVAWARPLRLFEVKAVVEALGCSVNDVLLACAAGALGTYLAEQGDAVEGIEMRALIPVNQRSPGPITELGNRFGLVFFPLPLGIAHPIERVLEVHKHMDALKHSQQAVVALGILASMGVLPEALKERVLKSLASNASAVITNVKGSGVPKYLAGKRIERHIFWVPQSGGIGLGISILSYAGKIDFGVMSDAKRIPHPAAIVQGFVDEFEALLLAVLLMPWPTDARPPKALGLDGRGKAASSEEAVGVSKGRKRPDRLRHTSMKSAARTSFGTQ